MTLKFTNCCFRSLALCLTLIPSQAALAKNYKTFYDYITSSDFNCSFNSKRIFKAGTIEKDYDASKVKSACLVTYSCAPLPGRKLKAFTAAEMCTSSEKGVCEEPLDCARRSHEGIKTFGTRSLEVASVAVSANNKFKDNCWETNGKKDIRGVMQILSNDGSVLEEACTSVFVCKNRPAPSMVVCATTSEIVQVDGKESSKAVCPQLNDCINGDLTVPGFTEKELDAMSPEQRERAMRQYEDGVEKAASANGSVGSRQTVSSASTGTSPVHTPRK